MGQKSSKASQIEPRYLAPQKLYCYSEVDLKKLRKLIKDRKLAPCFPGLDSDSRELEDCPICFLSFPSLNRAVCCHKPICTECFLQVKSLQAGQSPKCPYCKADFSIYFNGPASAEQKTRYQAEEQQQALAAKRAQQEEKRQCQQQNERRSPATPCCPAPQESSPQIPSNSLTKVSQQTQAVLQQYKDFFPHDLSALAEASDCSIDLNEVMLRQGICVSLNSPDQQATVRSGILADHGGHQTASIPIPAQTAPDMQSAYRHTWSSPGTMLSQAESIQAKSCRQLQQSQDTAASSSQVGSAIASVDSSSAPVSDGSVLVTVHKVQQSDCTPSDFLPSASSCSSVQAASSTQAASTAPAQQPLAASHVSSNNPCMGSKSCYKSGISSSSGCSGSGREGRSGAGGDSLAGFLQEQARAGQAGSQALLPHPASGTHELTVGMVLTEFTFVPHANGHLGNSLPGNPPVDRSAGKGSGGRLSGVEELGHAQSAGTPAHATQSTLSGGVRPGAVACSPEAAEVDLTGGAVLLQDPDGSVRYVVLTSEEQQAVQLSLKAQQDERSKQQGVTVTDAHQGDGTPEDQAVQEAIAKGDAILKRLYYTPEDSWQERAASASHEAVPYQGISQDSCRDRSVVQTDSLLERMENEDARLQALFAK